MDIDPRLRESLSSLAAADRFGDEPLEIRVRRGGGAPALEERLSRVASAVVDAAGGAVRTGGDHGDEPPARPALTLVGKRMAPIHYLALPEDHEATPFAEALAALATGIPGSATSGPTTGPAEVLVLVAPGCPNCPHAVRAAVSLLSSGHHLRLSVVDVTAFPELCADFNPRSVPVTVVDRRVQVVGVAPPDRLALLLLPPGTPERDRSVLTALLESGRFVEAAEELSRPGGVEAFAHLWTRSTLQTRMGLVLAADEVLSRQARALDAAVPGLRAALPTSDRARRGDTAEMLGKIGSEPAREALETLVDDPDEEVAEAARDALEGIELTDEEAGG